MPRGKDQKTISKRIDLHYWKKAHPLRTSRRILVLVCFLAAAGWMAYALGMKKEGLYNPGHVTSAHAIIEHDCKQCHTPDPEHKGQFLKTISDDACTKCHEAPLHAPAQLVRDDGNGKTNRLALARWIKDAGIKTDQSSEPAEMPQEGQTPPAEAAAAAAAASQPMDAHHGMKMVSSQCAVCHTEHRGREALAAVSDTHCTQCHADLNKAMQPGHTPEIQTRVVAFSKADHPAFGRRLPKDEQGNWIDNTKLQFNHKLHIVDQKLNDCTFCHTTWQPNLNATRAGHDPDKPPFPAEGTRPAEWAASMSGYMQPVNFEQHCSKCHQMKVKVNESVTLPHARMEIVRDAIYASFQKTAAERYAAGAPGAAEGSNTGGRRGRSSQFKSVGPADEGDFLRGELEKLNKAVSDAQKKCAQCHVMKDESAGKTVALAMPAAFGRGAVVVDRATAAVSPATLLATDLDMASNTRLLEMWDGRDELHETRLLDAFNIGATPQLAQVRHRPTIPGVTPAPAPTTPDAAASAPSPSGASPTTPAAPKPKPRPAIKPVALQTTEPTGIPMAPRRWFVSSKFDHRAHRDMACVECHSKLDNLDKIDDIADDATKAKLTAFATETKTVLSPGMQWTVYNFAKSGDKWKVSESTRSCTDCHRADTSTQRFTTAACVTCHNYHDHSKEMFPDGRMEPRVKTMAMASPSPAPAAAPGPAPTPAAEPTPAPRAEGTGNPTPTAPAESPTPAAPAAAPAAPAPPDAAAAPPVPAPAPAVPEPVPAAPPPPPAPPGDQAKPADQPAPAPPAPATEEPARKSRRPKNIPGS